LPFAEDIFDNEIRNLITIKKQGGYMANTALAKFNERLPFAFDDFFKPWNNWFETDVFPGRAMTMPAVNITDNKDDFIVSLAVPGMKKDDFKIDIDGNMITISCEKEEKKEDKEAKYTCKEYNYSSFSRSFTLPEEILKDKIEARYEDGVLKIMLPKKEEAKKVVISKHIAVK
jgi:HSP20 family protein